MIGGEKQITLTVIHLISLKLLPQDAWISLWKGLFLSPLHTETLGCSAPVYNYSLLTCRPLSWARQIQLELGWERPAGLCESAGEDTMHRGALSFSWAAFTLSCTFYVVCLSSLLRHAWACFVFISTNHFYSKTNLPFIYGNLDGIALDKRGLNCPPRQYKCLFFACFVSFWWGFFSIQLY